MNPSTHSFIHYLSIHVSILHLLFIIHQSNQTSICPSFPSPITHPYESVRSNIWQSQSSYYVQTLARHLTSIILQAISLFGRWGNCLMLPTMIETDSQELTLTDLVLVPGTHATYFHGGHFPFSSPKRLGNVGSESFHHHSPPTSTTKVASSLVSLHLELNVP